MKKITLSILLVFGSVLYTFAQQDPQFSQNMFNRLFTNPAYAGSSGAICGTLLGRDQWSGYDGDGQPRTGLLSIDAPIASIRSGVGLTLFQDALGYEKTFGVKLAYAYRFDVGATGKLGIGLDLGFLQKSIEGTKFKPNDPNDPFIPANVKGNVFPDLGAGIYYNSDKLYIGLSASHLTEGTFDLTTTKYNLARHYYGTAGYKFELTPTINLTPSIFVKNDGATTQLDGNLMATFNDKFWVGASYRLDDAIVAMLGFNVFNGLRIGYSYDFTSSELKNYSNGSHEIMLSYCYNPKKKPVFRNINVRYL